MSEAALPSFPVAVSPAAIPHLRRVLTRDGRPDVFLRIGVKGGGCSGFEYVLKLESAKRASDLEADWDGIRIVCDPKSAKFLEGSTLVYTGNLIGGGFKFENPNAARSCGCGTSFMPR
ncbi:MAG: iron-sulfur cluster assembly accessory protein [Armatimonadetes bacterium]|nr:iron-sulfur cluster assembly accessory protein [Armatimonadota bacterium]